MFSTTRAKQTFFYLAAVIAPVLTLLLRVRLEQRYGAFSYYVLFYPVVFLVAMLGDLWAGLLATAATAILVSYWVLPPRGQFKIASTGDVIGLPIFCAMGVAITLVAAVSERNREKVATYEKEQAVREAKRKSEDALRESEARFKLFMDNNPAVAWIKDDEGRYVYFNKTYERLYCMSLEDWRGRTDAELWPEEMARRLRENDLAVLESGRPMEVIEESATPDGSKRLLLNCKFLISSTTGKRFVAGIGVDITERKKAEEALRVSEERLRVLGDNLPNSVVYQYTHEPDGTPRFLYVSAGVEHVLGVKAEDALKDASTLHRQIPPHELPPLMEAEQRSARELSVFEREIQVQLPDGQLRWMHLMSHPRCLPDGRVIWDGVVTDITQRKRAQEAMLQSEKLAATGRLAATLAHEINNPLAAATNAVYVANTIPGKAGEMLELAERELRRAAHMTRQTLGFYREHSNVQSSIPKLVKELLVVYSTKLRNRRITVQCRYRCERASRRGECPEGCEGCEEYLVVNAGELRQVISNLLANGIDDLSDKGAIHIRVLRLPDRIQLTIADDGHGIRTEHLKRVFEPFFTTKEAYGTGLGLWITQELVRKHNGVIKVRSSKGKGTVFRLTFPQERSGDTVLLTASSTPPARAA